MSFILFTTGGAYLLLYEALVDTLVVSMYRFRKIFDSHVPFQLCIQRCEGWVIFKSNDDDGQLLP